MACEVCVKLNQGVDQKQAAQKGGLDLRLFGGPSER